MNVKTLERRYGVLFMNFLITEPLAEGAQNYVIRFEERKVIHARVSTGGTIGINRGLTARGMTARDAERKVAGAALNLCQYYEI